MSRVASAMVALALIGVAAPAHAVRIQIAPAPPPQSDDGDFWQRMLDPHATEVAQITTDVQQVVFAQMDQGYAMMVDQPLEQRIAVLKRALVQLRYARRLSPTNLTVLDQLAHVADELGQTRLAIEALQASIDITGPAQADPSVTGHLGAIYLRLGDLDDAIRYLQLAEGPAATPDSAAALIDLSTALALRGQMNDAIDVLAHALPPTYDYNAEQWGVAFALAVQYDRDDQRSAAYLVLEKLQGLLQDQSYGNQMQSWLSTIRFTPAEDVHYYQALLYETLGDYSEARAEWALYAASGGAFRGRALEHVAAIDAERRQTPGHIDPNAAAVPQTTRPPTIRMRRRYP